MSAFLRLLIRFSIALVFLFPIAASSASIRIAVPSEPVNIDPCNITRASVDRILRENVVETLVNMDFDTLTIQPALAESWEIINENEMRLFLKRGVRFHDGTELNAEAVIHSLERMYNTELHCIVYNKFFKPVRMEYFAESEYVLHIYTDTPNGTLLNKLANLAVVSTNMPMDRISNEPIGTGPYRLTNWQRGEFITLEIINSPFVAKESTVTDATFVFEPNQRSAASRILNSDIDIAYNIPSTLRSRRGTTDIVYLNHETVSVRIPVGNEYFANPEFRRALNLAINRTYIHETLMRNEVEFATQRVGPYALGWNPTLTPYRYNPDAAREIIESLPEYNRLREQSFHLTVEPSFFAEALPLAEIIVSNLREIGLDFSLNIVTFDEWLYIANNRQLEAQDPPSILLTMHDNTTGDAGTTLLFKYHSSGLQSDISDEYLDNLIENGMTYFGPLRQSLFREAFRTIYEDIIPDIPLFHLVNVMRLSDSIEYVRTGTNPFNINLKNIVVN